MTDPFPAQHTTRTIVTETHVAPQIRYDPTYIKTIPGIIKIVCIVLNFIGFLCIQVSGQAYFSRGEFFSSTAMFGFWLTIILLAMYIFHVIEKFYKIPWLKVEMYFCAVMCVFYLVASCLAVSWGQEAYTAAGFFGFCAMLAYGYDAFLKFNSVKAGEIAQGERVVHQQATVVTTY